MSRSCYEIKIPTELLDPYKLLSLESNQPKIIGHTYMDFNCYTIRPGSVLSVESGAPMNIIMTSYMREI